jgi:type II secretory pathway component HofQ
VTAGEDTGRDVDTSELSRLRDELAKAKRAQAEAAAAKAEAARAIAAARRESEQARDALSRARRMPVAAPRPVASSRVSALAFRGRNGSGDLEIALAGGVAVTSERVTRTYAELVLDNVDLGVDLERTMDVTKWGSPVRRVIVQRDHEIPRRVRVRIELFTAATPKLVRHARGLRWHVVENDVF